MDKEELLSMNSRGTRVYVGGLGDDITEDDLEDVFEPFGEILRVWVARNPPGHGFVTFAKELDAKRACARLNDKVLYGSILQVRFAHNNRGGRGGRGRGGRSGHSGTVVLKLVPSSGFRLEANGRRGNSTNHRGRRPTRNGRRGPSNVNRRRKNPTNMSKGYPSAPIPEFDCAGDQMVGNRAGPPTYNQAMGDVGTPAASMYPSMQQQYPPNSPQQYPPPAVPIVNTYVGMPQPANTNTNVTLNMAGGVIVLGPKSVRMICPCCHANIATTTVSSYKCSAHMCCLLLFCLVGIGWLCSCIPYCMDSNKTVKHKCPQCKSYLGTYNG